jgi:hypothetical protein
MHRIEYGTDADGSNRVELHVGSLPETYNRENGVIVSIDITNTNGDVYRKTLTRTNGSITDRSGWIKQ